MKGLSRTLLHCSSLHQERNMEPFFSNQRPFIFIHPSMHVLLWSRRSRDDQTSLSPALQLLQRSPKASWVFPGPPPGESGTDAREDKGAAPLLRQRPDTLLRKPISGFFTTTEQHIELTLPPSLTRDQTPRNFHWRQNNSTNPEEQAPSVLLRALAPGLEVPEPSQSIRQVQVRGSQRDIKL